MNDTKLKLNLEAEGALYVGSSGFLRGTIENFEGENYCCEWIRIHIATGNEESSLFLDDGSAVIYSNTASWNASHQLKKATDAENNEIVLQLREQGGGMRPLKKMDFTVSGHVGMLEGEVRIVFEYSYKKSGESSFQSEKKEFVFVKTRAGLYLRNFMASSSLDAAHFCTQYKPGETIYFSWEGNAGYYALYMAKENHMEQICELQETHYEFKDGITEDTTFVLVAGKNSAKPRMMDRKLMLGNQQLYGMLTLTTRSPRLFSIEAESGILAQLGTFTEKFSAEKAKVQMLEKAVELKVSKEKNSYKVKAETDGIIIGYLTCRSGNKPASAVIKISVYHSSEQGTEQSYAVQDWAYDASVNCVGGSMELRTAGNVMGPIAKNETAVLYVAMESDGDYEVNWYFAPFGTGKLNIV